MISLSYTMPTARDYPDLSENKLPGNKSVQV